MIKTRPTVQDQGILCDPECPGTFNKVTRSNNLAVTGPSTRCITPGPVDRCDRHDIIRCHCKAYAY